MNRSLLKRFALKTALFAAVLLPELCSAQYFNPSPYADVLAGFRKTGSFAGNYELVVDLGNITNFLTQPIGTTINITNFSPAQLTNAFPVPTGYSNLQWSVFCSFYDNSTAWASSLGSFPSATIWFTLPCTNTSNQTEPPTRMANGTQGTFSQAMNGVGTGGNSISTGFGTTNINNNIYVVREPVTDTGFTLTSFIGDASNPANGDFGGNGAPLPYTVENTTPTSGFTAAQRSDFYQVCPYSSGRFNGTDPITGQTNGFAYFLGYFLFYPNGTMTFTRAVTAAPIAQFSASLTTGTAPLAVTFSDSSYGNITNSIWNLGDGTSVTNTGTASLANVNHTYTSSGTYTVSLTTTGPGGVNTQTITGYIVVGSTSTKPPAFSSISFSGGNLVISGTNGTATSQFRVLMSTNLVLGNWTPVYTNSFSGTGTFSYTNGTTTGPGRFFRLVTP